MKSFYCATYDRHYIEEFFTERDIMFSFREIRDGYHVVLADQDLFILEILGGWEAVVDYLLLTRKHDVLARSTVPMGVKMTALGWPHPY